MNESLFLIYSRFFLIYSWFIPDYFLKISWLKKDFFSHFSRFYKGLQSLNIFWFFWFFNSWLFPNLFLTLIPDFFPSRFPWFIFWCHSWSISWQKKWTFYYLFILIYKTEICYYCNSYSFVHQYLVVIFQSFHHYELYSYRFLLAFEKRLFIIFCDKSDPYSWDFNF